MKNAVGIFAVFISLLTAANPVYAVGICPASTVSGDGIGDGCTTTYNGVDLSYLVPQVGVFKGTFTPACNNHDKCLTTLGRTVAECNGNFLADMQSACSSTFISWLQPAEYLACQTTASQYKGAVDLYLNTLAPNAFGGLQNNAWLVSRDLYLNVFNDSCATTPEKTTLFAPALITKINQIFSSIVGRNPSIYEFLTMVNPNNNNIVANPTAWQSDATNFAYARRFSPHFPVDYTFTIATGVLNSSITFSPSPDYSASNVSYKWFFSGLTPIAGKTAKLSFKSGAYDHNEIISGYVKATPSSGSTLDSSVGIIEPMTLKLKGTCGSNSSVICY